MQRRMSRCVRPAWRVTWRPHLLPARLGCPWDADGGRGLGLPGHGSCSQLRRGAGCAPWGPGREPAGLGGSRTALGAGRPGHRGLGGGVCAGDARRGGAPTVRLSEAPHFRECVHPWPCCPPGCPVGCAVHRALVPGPSLHVAPCLPAAPAHLAHSPWGQPPRVCPGAKLGKRPVPGGQLRCRATCALPQALPSVSLRTMLQGVGQPPERLPEAPCVTPAGARLRFRGLGCVGPPPRARGGWGRAGGREPPSSWLPLVPVWPATPPTSNAPPSRASRRPTQPLPHAAPARLQVAGEWGGSAGQGTHLPSSAVSQQLQVQVPPHLSAQARDRLPPSPPPHGS